MNEQILFSIEGDQYIITTNGAEWIRQGLSPVGSWEGRRVVCRALEGGTTRSRFVELMESMGARSRWRDSSGLTNGILPLIEHPSHIVILRYPPELRASNASEASAESLVDDSCIEDLRSDTWVEILVVDDLEEPCAGVEYEIELSDGRIRRGRTNEGGILRYEGIPDGMCKIKLLGLESASWKLC